LKGITGWQYRPFVPMERPAERGQPAICRLAPDETSVEVEIVDDSAESTTYTLHVRPRGGDDAEPWTIMDLDGLNTRVDGLRREQDYELFVTRQGDPQARSRTRLVRTGAYPDHVVNYAHPEDDVYGFSGRYLCDPALVRLPSGALLAGMSVFEGHGPQNLSLLFRSDDDGDSWRYVCDLFPAYWGTLFLNRGVLYFLGTHTENGHVLIGASHDEGRTWTAPTILFVGGGGPDTCGYQRQPMPILEHQGRLITSVDYGSWKSPTCYGIGTLSVDADADLLDPANWTVSEITYFDPDWPGAPVGGNVSVLEGSVYVASDGRLVNLTRMQIRGAEPAHSLACLFELDPDDLESAPRFLKIIDMPTGANSRTHVLRDEVSGRYWAIGNLVTNDATPHMRTVVGLCVSDDGYGWRVAKIVLDYRDEDPARVGLQYTSFIVDGDDILHLTRTSINGAHNFHDANCQTFGVVTNFRSL